MNNPGPVAKGATFQVPVVISGAQDIASVPLRMHYDSSKLALVNVAPGDFLARGGQAIQASVRDDGPGNLTINASRPVGAGGVNGAGVVYVLTFQAKAAGPSDVTITQPGAMTSKQQPIPASASALNVVVK
jgi:general secretion pathway protein D